MQKLYQFAAFVLLLGVHQERRCFAESPGTSTQPVELEPGIRFVEIPAQPPRPKIWAYLPLKSPTTSIPAIFIAPAGSSGLFGNPLVESDRPEHLPWARAGFAVIAYELTDPKIDKKADIDQKVVYAKSYMDARFGLSDLSSAIDYSKNVKAIDQSKLIAVGHSSAATVALRVAALEPRISRCIAFAPVVDVVKAIPPPVIRYFDLSIPGYKDAFQSNSPHMLMAKIKCPTFIFAAKDDSVVAFADVERFVTALKESNSLTQFDTVPAGDHYDSMISEGIKRAIVWLKSNL